MTVSLNMMLRKMFLTVALACSLAACAQFKELVTSGVPNPVTADRVLAVKSAYGIALSAAVAYHDSCAKRLIPPSCRPIVVKLQAAGTKVEIAIARLEALRKLGSAIDLTEAIDAVLSAIDDLKRLTPGN